jgi:hypothetical protein
VNNVKLVYGLSCLIVRPVSISNIHDAGEVVWQGARN